MFEALSDKLKKVLKDLRGQGRVTEANVEAAEVRQHVDGIGLRLVEQRKRDLFAARGTRRCSLLFPAAAAGGESEHGER